jgi:hypothetical protein
MNLCRTVDQLTFLVLLLPRVHCAVRRWFALSVAGFGRLDCDEAIDDI